ASHHDVAVGGHVDAVEVQHQGGLTGAVRPDQGHPLAGLDGEIDAEQGLVAVRVGVHHRAHLEGGRAHTAHTAHIAHAAHAASEIPAASAGTLSVASHW